MIKRVERRTKMQEWFEMSVGLVIMRLVEEVVPASHGRHTNPNPERD
jgi:hypothetical protein